MTNFSIGSLIVFAVIFFVVWKYKAEEDYKKRNIDSSKILSRDGRMYSLDGTEIYGEELIKLSVPFEINASKIDELINDERHLLIASCKDMEQSKSDKTIRAYAEGVKSNSPQKEIISVVEKDEEVPLTEIHERNKNRKVQ